MARKRPRMNLSQPIQPREGEIEKLFATQDDVEQAAGLELLAVRIDAIQPDPDQPRSTFPRESLEELSNSIRQDGVIQPIEVAEVRPEVFMIIHGERRWRAAKMAGLETIPAVVRRRNYDELTRFVRQIVENIQREDLNDVDRAAGLIRLRDLMQQELDQARSEDVPADKPWGKRITWSKVAERLGYSRQRIHQLIQLLDLPEEIKSAVQEGELSERDTRIYQGLKPSQQRALHRLRVDGDITPAEMKKVARLLKDRPELTAHQAVRLLHAPEENNEQSLTSLHDPTALEENTRERPAPEEAEVWQEEGVIPTRSGGLSDLDRLARVRGHLQRLSLDKLTTTERRAIVRVLQTIQRDVGALLDALDE